MIDAATIVRGLEKTGKSKGGLAKVMGVRAGAVSEILSGIRLVKASEIAPITEYLELNFVPIMGRVGAGAVIEPDYEQVPPDGIGEIGDVIVVYKEQRHPLSSFFGEEAAVRLKTGERYLKTIERGKGTSQVNLTSFNAKAINGVKLDWIGEICLTLPRAHIGRLRAKTAARARKAKK
jgi:repressor LexA